MVTFSMRGVRPGSTQPGRQYVHKCKNRWLGQAGGTNCALIGLWIVILERKLCSCGAGTTGTNQASSVSFREPFQMCIIYYVVYRLAGRLAGVLAPRFDEGARALTQ